MTRTGCMYGVHLETSPNRFERMKITHPKLYDFCVQKLGVAKVLRFMESGYK